MTDPNVHAWPPVQPDMNPTPAPAPVADHSNDTAQADVVPRREASTEAVKQDLPTPADTSADKPQSYVHLADGSVLRVNDEDLPSGGTGTGAPHGFWQRANSIFHIIGIWPVETKVEGNK